MNKHLEILEFPKLLAHLAQHTTFAPGKELALRLRPSPHLTQVQTRQAETTEACRLLAERPELSLNSARDVRPYPERARRGIILPAEELLQIRQTLITARDLQRSLARLAETYPLLTDIANRVDPCTGLVNEIGNAIDERAEVKSSASPALAHIRREIEVAHGRLMEKLTRIIGSSRNGPYLQEALITQRAGRYVIPLKTDFKGRIPGVVHDQSASGMTVFVEPISTVDLNNRWRQLQLDETNEIQRILAELSERVGRHSGAINHTVSALADLDLALAKARYAEALDAVSPELVGLKRSKSEEIPGQYFKLRAARHPLLDARTVVPIEVWLPEEARMLVITGPNTGGKTVSLKTVGLLAAMTQAGLRIPAEEGSVLPVFDFILADIGDEQSIEQSLSTFSGHLTNIVRILKRCSPRSLVIFDELGAGTDPIEGSALARSILERLLQRGVTTFVATHYSELKAFAHTTPGAANASMAFDPETLSPSYKLRIGLPGASNAFTIAGRLGLSEQIINHARNLVGEDTRQIEAMLDDIKAELAAAHEIRQEAEAKRTEAEAVVAAQEQRLVEVEAERKDILNSARADARREIKAVREKIRAMQAQAEAELAVLRTETEAAHRHDAKAEPVELAAVEEKLETLAATVVDEPEQQPTPEHQADDEPPRVTGPVQAGDTVFVRQFGALGQVISRSGIMLEVQLGHFRTTVNRAEVELRQKAAAQIAEARPGIVEPVVESPGMELDLRGQVTEEALYKLDRYLDQAFLARLPWVHIIHGRGSGALRQAVREALRGHPQVSSFKPGNVNEGGEGVTVIKLSHS